MAKSKQRKKAVDKKKANIKLAIEKKQRLKHYYSEYEKATAMVNEEKNRKRSTEMDIIKNWGESEETQTPTQQMMF